MSKNEQDQSTEYYTDRMTQSLASSLYVDAPQHMETSPQEVGKQHL